MEDAGSTTRSKRTPVTCWISSAIRNRASYSVGRLRGTPNTDLSAVKDYFVSTAILLLRMHEPDADHVRAELRNARRLIPGWLQHED